MSPESNTLSCYILSFNNEKTLEKVLSSVVNVADEVIILDSGSTDKTIDIANAYHCKVSERTFDNFVNQRNHAISLCTGDWILQLDSDEILDEELQASIKTLKQNQFINTDREPDAYAFPRYWYVCGKPVHAFYPVCSPDYPTRLFKHTEKALYDTQSNWVHEDQKQLTDIERIRKGGIHHYTCETWDELKAKLPLYCKLAADDLIHRNKNISLAKKTFSPFMAWFKWYLRKGGYRDGLLGWKLGLYAYQYTSQKYTIARKKVAQQM